ncbi:MAG: hypothetical protein GF408_06735 [Candidatus Omnitrophica bacterium]|nr:hypothetical protein [Candidatus Omnitrophota bacterium]
MEIMNLDKLPAEARKKIEPYARGLLEVYGKEVISLFVYGSVTGLDFDPRTSDINIGVFLRDTSLDALKKSLGIVKKGIRKKINAPLFLTKEYLERSLDSFPVEFMEMKDSRCVLYGEDVLETVAVKKQDLRVECESQIKGKLIVLKQAYLEQALNRKGLEKLIKEALKSLLPVFRNMLRIKRDAKPPTGKKEMLAMFGTEFGIDTGAFIKVLEDKKSDGKIGRGDAEDFLEDFTVQLGKLSLAVDKL